MWRRPDSPAEINNFIQGQRDNYTKSRDKVRKEEDFDHSNFEERERIVNDEARKIRPYVEGE